MGKDFFESSAVAKATFETANRVLGFDLSTLCFAGAEERLNQTDISQPAIFTTSVACYRAAVDAKVIDPAAVTAYAGLSLGEYTALHLAGVFTFEEGLKLVAARGKYMQEAAVASPSGMVAIMGGDEASITKLCEENAGGEVLVPANFNTVGQVVVSGSLGACDRVAKAAEAAGLKSVVLKVAGAFHSSIMQPGADKMKAELDAVQFKSPQKPVYSNVTAQLHEPATMKAMLVKQIIAPVRWEQTITPMAATPDVRIIELAPGRSIAGMLKRINRRLPVESLSTADTLVAKV
jgi:[acyl-carrier-protein] S-malonyltransferase